MFLCVFRYFSVFAIPFFGPFAHTLLTATCKQPCVYQFLVVILVLCAPCPHMIIDSEKRGPSIASRHLDLHLNSHCDGVLLKQCNLSLAQG